MERCRRQRERKERKGQKERTEGKMNRGSMWLRRMGRRDGWDSIKGSKMERIVKGKEGEERIDQCVGG